MREKDEISAQAKSQEPKANGREGRFICHYCNKGDKELRPYGPGGAFVCFDCAMATDERRAQAEEQLRLRLDGAARSSAVVLLGEQSGPRPLGGGGDA